MLTPRIRHNVKSFTQVFVDLPEYSQIVRFVSVPYKTVFINVAADADANQVAIIQSDVDPLLAAR